MKWPRLTTEVEVPGKRVTVETTGEYPWGKTTIHQGSPTEALWEAPVPADTTAVKFHHQVVADVQAGTLELGVDP